MSAQAELLVESLNPQFQAIPGHDINIDGSFTASVAPSESQGPEIVDTDDKSKLFQFDLLNKLGMAAKVYESGRKESFDEDDLYNEEVFTDSYTNAEGDFSLSLFQRTDDEVRQAYLNRLINMKILKLQPVKKHQEIILLDWDDTLLCTSYLGRYGLVHLPEKILEDLKVLDNRVSLLLETATSFGKTYIITNAEEGWVAYTGMMFLPKSYKIIQEKIEVISARNKYQEKYPEDTYRWKVESFLDLKKMFDSSLVANIFCVGDSRVEMEAARCLGESLNHAIVKTVKFKTTPGVQDLIKQIDLLNDRFEYIITSRTSLTIRLEKKSA